MGWIARATGCAFLLVGTHADAGGRIAYPSAGQMYVLLAADVRVFFTAPAPAVPAVATTPQSPLFTLAPMPTGLASAGFGPGVRAEGIQRWVDPILDMRAESFRQDLFPEQQRVRMASPTDTMLTFSIGGSYGPKGTLCLQGGVAGALWHMSHPLTGISVFP